MHRTLRPEAYGGLAQQRLANRVNDYPLHDEFLRSEALGRSKAKRGTHPRRFSFPLLEKEKVAAPIAHNKGL